VAQRGFGAETPDFPRDCDHLKALPTGRWRDFLFLAMENPSLSLAQQFREVDESLARMPLDGMKMSTQTVEAREVPGNWKQHAWNYMDFFHVSFIHRSPGGLADAIDLSTYRTELYERSSLQWAYARNPAHGFDPAHLPERFADKAGRRVFALWWYIFPNLTLNFYPWGLSVNVYQPVPGRPDATKFLWYHHVLDAAKYELRDEHWLNRQVDAEDVEALAQSRMGLRSGFAPRGRFAPIEEAGPHWFHRLVSESIQV
jgi:choline monooxygenase